MQGSFLLQETRNLKNVTVGKNEDFAGRKCDPVVSSSSQTLWMIFFNSVKEKGKEHFIFNFDKGNFVS